MSGPPDPTPGLPDDPLPILHTKLVVESKTDQQTAAELGVAEDVIRALRARYRRPLRVAAFSHRLGRYLGGGYPQAAFNALIQLLAVLVAFIMGNAWQVRVAEVSDLRSQLAVLRPVLAEINVLHQKAVGLQRSPPQRCGVDFTLSSNPLVPAFPRWEAIRVSEGGLLLRQELFDTVRKSYDELSLAPVNSAGLDQAGCQVFLGGVITDLNVTRQAVVKEIDHVEADRRSIRAQLQTPGLLAFLGLALALSVAILLVPVVVHRIAVIATRVVR
ncbi:MAG: hypothetical protein ACT4PY_14195 [Armatimonadota bacterium]